MTNLFDKLQDMMLNREREHLKTLIPYYETLWQHRDKIQELQNEINNYPEISVQYRHDPENHYTDGVIEVLFHMEIGDWHSQPDFYYEIELFHDERMWGYCTCSVDDEGYVAEKGCCGNECDWIAPGIRVKRIHHVTYATFDGIESDMWKLEEKWSGDLADHNRKVKLEKLERLQEHLKETEMEIESIKNSLRGEF